MKIHISIFMVIISFAGCSVIKEGLELVADGAEKIGALTQCTVEIVDVNKFVSFTQKTSNIWNYVIEFSLIVKNPTEHMFSLGHYEIDVYANGKHLSEIKTYEKLELRPISNNLVIAKTIISPNGAIGLFMDKLTDASIEYKLYGTFFLNYELITYPLRVELIKYVEE